MIALATRLAAPYGAHLSGERFGVRSANLLLPPPLASRLPSSFSPSFLPDLHQYYHAYASKLVASAVTGPTGGSTRRPLPASATRGNKTLANVRAVLFFLFSFILAIPIFLSMLTMHPFVMTMDKYRRLFHHVMNNMWAKVSSTPFYSVEIIGRENLPPPDLPVVYVANHQSFMDIYSLFHLDRPFKFISKTSNFLIPVVGWSMFLTGHVMINRVDRKSQIECLKACSELLARQASVLFFPEGTRSKTKVMAGFKKGAFSVAVKAGVDVVPITLLGTGDLMPSGREGEMYPGTVTAVVHPPIPTKGRSAGEVCAEARRVIASALPPELVGEDVAAQTEGD